MMDRRREPSAPAEGDRHGHHRSRPLPHPRRGLSGTRRPRRGPRGRLRVRRLAGAVYGRRRSAPRSCRASNAPTRCCSAAARTTSSPAYWPFQPADDPVAAKFAAIPKYVVSRTLSDPSWAGTTVLPDAAAVGRLRDEFDEVHTWGSGELLRSLLAEGLLDRLNLWMYPIALGTGKRLFDTGIGADGLPPGAARARVRFRGHGPRVRARGRCRDGRGGGQRGVASLG